MLFAALDHGFQQDFEILQVRVAALAPLLPQAKRTALTATP
jgi:hypothetical protein